MSSDAAFAQRIAVIAPHPDDETMGCGGTLLRFKDENPDAQLHWIIVTAASLSQGYKKRTLEKKESEIGQVARAYGFTEVHRLRLPTAELDQVPLKQIVEMLGAIVKKTAPTDIYLPYPNDVHTDHGIVFDAAKAFSKWFRYRSVRRVLVYETLSETDFCLDPDARGFRPNRFVDISRYLNKKLKIMEIYGSEMGEFPFPRSRRAIESLARVRGATAGMNAAEAFMVLKELV